MNTSPINNSQLEEANKLIHDYVETANYTPAGLVAKRLHEVTGEQRYLIDAAGYFFLGDNLTEAQEACVTVCSHDIPADPKFLRIFALTSLRQNLFPEATEILKTLQSLDSTSLWEQLLIDNADEDIWLALSKNKTFEPEILEINSLGIDYFVSVEFTACCKQCGAHYSAVIDKTLLQLKPISCSNCFFPAVLRPKLLSDHLRQKVCPGQRDELLAVDAIVSVWCNNWWKSGEMPDVMKLGGESHLGELMSFRLRHVLGTMYARVFQRSNATKAGS